MSCAGSEVETRLSRAKLWLFFTGAIRMSHSHRSGASSSPGWKVRFSSQRLRLQAKEVALPEGKAETSGIVTPPRGLRLSS